MRRRVWIPLLGLGSLLASACATGGGLSEDEALYGAASAETAVRAFLEAAGEEDYRRMGRLFGTAEGPAERTMSRSELDQRMFILAAFLDHDTASVRRSQLTEGPNRIRFLVDLTGTRNGNVTVPFIATSSRGRWYVERVITDALSRGTRR